MVFVKCATRLDVGARGRAHARTSTLSPGSKANRAGVNDNTRRPPSGSQDVCGDHVDAFWASVMMLLGGQKRGEERRSIQDRHSLPRCVQGRRDISAESPKTAACDAHVRVQADLAGGFNRSCADKLRLPRSPPPKPNNPPHPV